MALIDLGEKQNDATEYAMGESPIASDRSETQYPSIFIRNKDLPFDKEDVGTILRVEAIIKLKQMDAKYKGGGDKIEFEFEVRKIDFLKTKEQEDFTRDRVETKRERGG